MKRECREISRLADLIPAKCSNDEALRPQASEEHRERYVDIELEHRSTCAQSAIQGLGWFGIWGFGLECRVWGSEFWVEGLGFRTP